MNEKMTTDEALLLLKWAEQDRDNYKAEVERLQEELNEAKESRDQHFAGRQTNAKEVERLRGALKTVTEALVGADLQLEGEFGVGGYKPDPAIAIGRNALAEEKE